jgi:preprotein translocase SecF subunit
MMRHLRLVPDNTKFNFMGFRPFTFPFSALASLFSITLFFIVGLNYGIDFKGGTLIEIKAHQGHADISEVRSLMDNLKLGEVQVQEFGSDAELLIRLEQQKGGEETQRAANDQARAVLAEKYDIRRIEVVGPQVSGELIQAGIIAVVLSVLAILIYLWARFEWQFAVAAIIATLHDVILTIGFFAILKLDFNLTSIAAILTIIGYSLNDTVVVFDRIRETLRRYKKMNIAELLNLSINEMLGRTILVSLTALLALIALAVFGGEVIRSFTLAMIWGVVVGTYSSIFIAAPVLIYMNLRASSLSNEPKD